MHPRHARDGECSLGQLAAGGTVEDVLHEFPYLERDDVLAALEWAAAAAQDRELPLAASA